MLGDMSKNAMVAYRRFLKQILNIFFMDTQPTSGDTPLDGGNHKDGEGSVMEEEEEDEEKEKEGEEEKENTMMNQLNKNQIICQSFAKGELPTEMKDVISDCLKNKILHTNVTISSFFMGAIDMLKVLAWIGHAKSIMRFPSRHYRIKFFFAKFCFTQKF